jgi:SAM-dependent methyltransferase
MRDTWDQRYSEPGYTYGLEPNRFFREIVEPLTPGRILLPGEGEGRHAVWAALRGWQVDAMDQSPVARDKALALAEEHGVVIRYDVLDLAAAKFPENTYEAVALVFVHLHSTVRSKVHRRLAASLRPGGRLLMEVFAKGQFGRTSGGPRDLDLLYSADDLRADFSDLQIVRLQEITTRLDEGPLHQGEAAVVQLLAVRE